MEIEYIVEDSVVFFFFFLVDRSVVGPWCMDDPKATSANWWDLLRAACSQDFRPLDIIQAMGKHNETIGMLSVDGGGGSPSSGCKEVFWS
jgi:hypothetical protein